MEFLFFNANAGGVYDGIWQIENENVMISMHENNGIMVMVELNANSSFWGAGMGQRYGTTTRINSIDSVSVLNITYDIIFISPTSFKAIQVTCSQKYTDVYCAHPNGYVSYGYKIF